MSQSGLDSRLQARITAFVEEINALVREAAVDAVEQALTQGRSPSRRTPRTAAPKRAKSGKRVRRSGAQVDALAERALVAIRREPGRRLGEIAKELRVPTKDARRPVQNLLDDKHVRTTGQRGGTRYFPAGGAQKSAGTRKPARAKKKKKAAKRKAKQAK